MQEQPIIRALTVNEILDKALRIYRAKFVVLLGIVAVVLIPEGVLEFIATIYFGDIQRLTAVLNSIFSTFATLALIIAISNTYLGQEFSISSAYSNGLKKIWSIFGAGLLIGLVIILPVIAIGICVALVSGELAIIGILLILPFILYLSTRWSLSSQAIVLEDLGASDGLKRSWELTKDYFWRVFGTSFAASLLSLFLTLLPGFFAEYILGLLGFSVQTITLAGLAAQQISLIFAMPFTVAVQVLIYYDLRIRKEGFDLLLRTNKV